MHKTPAFDPLEGLSDKQREAVVSFGQPLLILSSSGTGKTHVLTRKLAYAIQRLEIPANRILAVTFTRKAAHELRSRIAHLLGEASESMFVGTFHNISARILRTHQSLHTGDRAFTVIDRDNQIQMMKNVISASGLSHAWDGRHLDKKINSLLSSLDTLKSHAVDITADEREINWGPLPRPSLENLGIMRAYQKALKSTATLDYNDLILDLILLARSNKAVASAWSKHFSLVMIDEYQDTNNAQEEWIRIFSPTGQNLVCVGDDDQSIYGWRGANPGNILDFEKRYPNTKTITLDINYRSPPEIVDSAMALISSNTRRRHKSITSASRRSNGTINIHRLSGDHETFPAILDIVNNSAGASLDEIAILTRVNKQANELTDYLHKSGVPVWRYNPDVDSSPQLTAYLNWLRILANPADNTAVAWFLERMINPATADSLWKAATLSRQNLLAWIVDNAGRGRLSMPALLKFTEAYDALSFDMINNSNDVLLDIVLDKTGISTQLARLSPQAQQRFYRQYMAMRSSAAGQPLHDIITHAQTEVADTSARPEGTVAISTMHGMKGLESPVVITPDWTTGVFPSYQATAEELEESRRLAFVTVTRASRAVHILYNGAKGPSPFIDDLGPRNTKRPTAA